MFVTTEMATIISDAIYFQRLIESVIVRFLNVQWLFNFIGCYVCKA